MDELEQSRRSLGSGHLTTVNRCPAELPRGPARWTDDYRFRGVEETSKRRHRPSEHEPAVDGQLPEHCSMRLKAGCIATAP